MRHLRGASNCFASIGATVISDVELDVELPIRDCTLGESQLGDVTLDVELPIREATAKSIYF